MHFGDTKSLSRFAAGWRLNRDEIAPNQFGISESASSDRRGRHAGQSLIPADRALSPAKFARALRDAGGSTSTAISAASRTLGIARSGACAQEGARVRPTAFSQRPRSRRKGSLARTDRRRRPVRRRQSRRGGSASTPTSSGASARASSASSMSRASPSSRTRDGGIEMDEHEDVRCLRAHPHHRDEARRAARTGPALHRPRQRACARRRRLEASARGRKGRIARRRSRASPGARASRKPRSQARARRKTAGSRPGRLQDRFGDDQNEHSARMRPRQSSLSAGTTSVLLAPLGT